MDFTTKHLIELAFAEDIGPGDITTDYLIDADADGEGYIMAKQDLVLCGTDIAVEVFKTLDPDVTVTQLFNDGDAVDTGDMVMEFKGRMRALLKGERTALNFMQRLSGIATNVRQYADEMAGSSARIVDTRKTIPGWRALEKYAVRVGGAYNHRTALYDGVLIKDNHIAACGGIQKAVSTLRKHVSHLVKIEVEVTDMDEVMQALDAKADVIMLDNMNLEEIIAAVQFIDKRALVEVSGSVTLDQLKDLAATGVDIISSGALTHQAKSVDLSMKIR
jgi:nicotinate-nucleotide pyrophosphorylase (carboxylating)